MGEEKREEDELFKATMERKWEKVVEIYRKCPSAPKALLTKSEETALHIAISSFHSHSDATCIKDMIDIVSEKESLEAVLKMKNVRGDTLLHLAAAVGSEYICELVVENPIVRDPKEGGKPPSFGLIRERNARGETPLFVAVHHGNMRAFLSLQKAYSEPQQIHEPLRRTNDGDTILHSAISGQYFRLAYQIINDYPPLIHFINANGESPLHILARKPNVFKSSSHFRLYDSIIYKCVFVDKLKTQKYVSKATRNSYSFKQNLPENYTTCGDILSHLWNLILIITALSSIKENGNSNDKEKPAKDTRDDKENGNSNDEENQQKKHESLSSNKKNGFSNDEEKQQIPENERESNKSGGGFFPANYDTCILLFKCAMKTILIILGIGFGRIKKIKDKKERCHNAIEIMNEMINRETRYNYDSSSGQQDKNHETLINVDPYNPPTSDDQVEKQNNEDQNKSAEDERPNVKESPLLVATKMGILEMVKKILKEFPVAIQDNDHKGKNALMLAAEYRQSSVFNYLIGENLPEYMFHHLDQDKNGILHLAAKLPKALPWRIPGAALQMQWEFKWYKHVKQTVSGFNLSHANSEGETPRMAFSRTHEELVKAGNQWLIKTSESCSVIAALIAGVAFATSATVPGGLHQDKGYPNLKDHKAFDVFSIASLIALCLSITALVFFLAIITSRCEARDFKSNLPKKLLMGLSSLFASIVAMLLSFCAGHTFILRDKLKLAAVPIYAFAIIPIAFFAIAQLPLYFDLLLAAYRKVPLRSYKVFY